MSHSLIPPKPISRPHRDDNVEDSGDDESDDAMDTSLLGLAQPMPVGNEALMKRLGAVLSQDADKKEDTENGISGHHLRPFIQKYLYINAQMQTAKAQIEEKQSHATEKFMLAKLKLYNHVQLDRQRCPFPQEVDITSALSKEQEDMWNTFVRSEKPFHTSSATNSAAVPAAQPDATTSFAVAQSAITTVPEPIPTFPCIFHFKPPREMRSAACNSGKSHGRTAEFLGKSTLEERERLILFAAEKLGFSPLVPLKRVILNKNGKPVAKRGRPAKSVTANAGDVNAIERFLSSPQGEPTPLNILSEAYLLGHTILGVLDPASAIVAAKSKSATSSRKASAAAAAKESAKHHSPAHLLKVWQHYGQISISNKPLAGAALAAIGRKKPERHPVNSLSEGLHYHQQCVDYAAHVAANKPSAKRSATVSGSKASSTTVSEPGEKVLSIRAQHALNASPHLHQHASMLSSSSSSSSSARQTTSGNGGMKIVTTTSSSFHAPPSASSHAPPSTSSTFLTAFQKNPTPFVEFLMAFLEDMMHHLKSKRDKKQFLLATEEKKYIVGKLQKELTLTQCMEMYIRLCDPFDGQYTVVSIKKPLPPPPSGSLPPTTVSTPTALAQGSVTAVPNHPAPPLFAQNIGLSMKTKVRSATFGVKELKHHTAKTWHQILMAGVPPQQTHDVMWLTQPVTELHQQHQPEEHVASSTTVQGTGTPTPLLVPWYRRLAEIMGDTQKLKAFQSTLIDHIDVFTETHRKETHVVDISDASLTRSAPSSAGNPAKRVKL